MQVEKELSGRKGDKTPSKNQLNEDERNAVEAIKQDLKEQSCSKDSLLPRFQFIEVYEISKPDIGVVQEDDNHDGARG